jgi:hypothetical protein
MLIFFEMMLKPRILTQNKLNPQLCTPVAVWPLALTVGQICVYFAFRTYKLYAYKKHCWYLFYRRNYLNCVLLNLCHHIFQGRFSPRHLTTLDYGTLRPVVEVISDLGHGQSYMYLIDFFLFPRLKSELADLSMTKESFQKSWEGVVRTIPPRTTSVAATMSKNSSKKVIL